MGCKFSPGTPCRHFEVPLKTVTRLKTSVQSSPPPTPPLALTTRWMDGNKLILISAISALSPCCWMVK